MSGKRKPLNKPSQGNSNHKLTSFFDRTATLPKNPNHSHGIKEGGFTLGVAKKQEDKRDRASLPLKIDESEGSNHKSSQKDFIKSSLSAHKKQ